MSDLVYLLLLIPLALIMFFVVQIGADVAAIRALLRRELEPSTPPVPESWEVRS